MDRKQRDESRAISLHLGPISATRMLMDLYGSEEAERALRHCNRMNDEQIEEVMRQANTTNH